MLARASQKMSTIESKIREVLLQARISKSYKGYSYLERAIFLIIEDETRLCSIYEEVYTRIGRHFNVAPTSVEKNLRTLRDSFWQNNGYDYFKEQCGITLYNRPFPREMIEILAEQVIKKIKKE